MCVMSEKNEIANALGEMGQNGTGLFQLALNAITTSICFSVGNWGPYVSR
jgi:hypothetical protein